VAKLKKQAIWNLKHRKNPALTKSCQISFSALIIRSGNVRVDLNEYKNTKEWKKSQ